jgi:F-type H+-transporting ATPase subunit b
MSAVMFTLVGLPAQEGEEEVEEEHHEFEAHDPILPETNEIIWGGLASLLVFFLLFKAAGPQIKKGMQARSDRVQAEIDAAAAARAEGERVLAEYRAQLGDAEAESARIVAEARQVAEALRRDQSARMEAEFAELRTRATADIGTAGTRLVTDLQSEIGRLAIGAAERIVARNLQPDTQAALVDRFIEELATSGNGAVRR